MTTLEGIGRNPGTAIAVAAVVDAKSGINGVSHALLKSGISALTQNLPPDDYPEVIIACDSLTIGSSIRIPGIQAVGIAAEAVTEVPELTSDLPCVIGVADLLSSITEGDILIVDGYKGVVHIDPDPPTLIHYQQAEEQKHAREKVFITSEHIHARTQTGEIVFVYARLDDESKLTLALDNGADGLLVDLRGRSDDLATLCSRILRDVAGKPVKFVVDTEIEEILRAAMIYCTPMQVTLVSNDPDMLIAQVETLLDRITLEALQLDLEAPQVNISRQESPVSLGSIAEIEALVRSGVRMITVDPESVPEAKFAIRSVSLEPEQ